MSHVHFVNAEQTLRGARVVGCARPSSRDAQVAGAADVCASVEGMSGKNTLSGPNANREKTKL